MPPRNPLTRISLPHQSLRSQPFLWQGVLFCGVLLVLILLSIRSVPAWARRQTIAGSGEVASLFRMTPGELQLRNQVGLRPADNDQVLIGSLATGLPFEHQLATMSRLVQIGQTDSLIAALDGPSSDIRLAAIRVLGWKHAASAVIPLIRTSYDPDPTLREAALAALGETESWLALPRLQQAQIVEKSFYIQQAAYLAEQELSSHLASELGIGVSGLQAVAVAENSGIAYAVTSDGLFVRQPGGWARLSNIPGAMTGVITTSSDGNIVYLGTMSGLYVTEDGGMTWQIVPMPVCEQADVRATAALINQRNPHQVFVTLATSTLAKPVASTPLGTFVSTDSARSWFALPDSPRDYMTTRLVLDFSEPPHLFGATGVGTWRYTLSESATSTHSD